MVDDQFLSGLIRFFEHLFHLKIWNIEIQWTYEKLSAYLLLAGVSNDIPMCYMKEKHHIIKKII